MLLLDISIELVFRNVASREVATAKAASYSDSSECQVAIFFSFRLWTFAVLKSTVMIVGTYQITHNSSFCECGVSPFAPEITRNLSKGRHSRPLDLICPREFRDNGGTKAARGGELVDCGTVIGVG